MLKEENQEMKISNHNDINNAILGFSKELVNSLPYQKFEIAKKRFGNDMAAQTALQEYQSRAREFQLAQRLNTLSPEDQQELNRLWMAFQSHDSVIEYFNAQEEFQALCRTCAQIISDTCELDFATACGASCCG